MIRNIIIMAASGLVLFSKEFANSIAQPRLVGSLITAIIEFGQQTTGMGVSFIELSNISIAIVCNESVKIFCAIFYDREDGKLFGRLICSEILCAFIQDYSSEFAQFGLNLRDFRGFHRKISDIVHYAVRPVITHLESQRGIRKAMLVRELEVVDSQKEEHDDFAILATLPTLMEMANELLMIGNDFLQSLVIDTDAGERLMIWKIREKTLFLVVTEKHVPLAEYAETVEDALEVIEQSKPCSHMMTVCAELMDVCSWDPA